MSETHPPPCDIAAATEQAHVLAQALPFLRRYAGATVVVKYGGHAMGEEHLAQQFGNDIALLKQVGINPVVVHGGGPQINAMLKRLAIQSTFIDGLRVTDAAMVEVVEMVLAGTVNKYVAGLITKAGALAVGVCGKDGGDDPRPQAAADQGRSPTAISSGRWTWVSSASRPASMCGSSTR